MTTPTTFAEYRNIKAVNWSTLKAMDDSPAHYKAAIEHGRDDTDALRLGRLADVLLFTPEAFEAKFAVWEHGDRRGNAYKAFEAVAETMGRDVVKPADVTEGRALADAVRTHPEVADILDGAEFQVPIVWVDPVTGLRCKGLADIVNWSKGILADLKSAVTIEKRRFMAAAGKYRYHCQLAHYRAGLRVSREWTPERVCIIGAEKGRPHDVGVFDLHHTVIAAGAVTVSDLLARVAECEAAGTWPGRYPARELVTMDDMPRWLLDDDTDDDADSLGLTSASDL